MRLARPGHAIAADDLGSRASRRTIEAVRVPPPDQLGDRIVMRDGLTPWSARPSRPMGSWPEGPRPECLPGPGTVGGGPPVPDPGARRRAAPHRRDRDAGEPVPDVTSSSRTWRLHRRLDGAPAVVDQLVRYPTAHADNAGVRFFNALVLVVRRAAPRKLLFGSNGPRCTRAWSCMRCACFSCPDAERLSCTATCSVPSRAGLCCRAARPAGRPGPRPR